MLRNLHTKRCENCEHHKRREETGEKTMFSALYIPPRGFKGFVQFCIWQTFHMNEAYWTSDLDLCGKNSSQYKDL